MIMQVCVFDSKEKNHHRKRAWRKHSRSLQRQNFAAGRANMNIKQDNFDNGTDRTETSLDHTKLPPAQFLSIEENVP
jgi:hypothetical protein